MTIEIQSGTTWVDITPYIKFGGLTFSRNDVEAPSAGRTLDGKMHRMRVAVKERMDIETIPLSKDKVQYLLTLLYPPTFNVRVTPYPLTNAEKVMNMYSNSVKATYIIHRSNGDDIHSISFPLVEV